MPLHVSNTRAFRQEVKIALHSLWYHHTYRRLSRAQVERAGQQNVKKKYEDIKQIHCNYFMSAWQRVPKSFRPPVTVKLLRSSQMVGMTEDNLWTADLLSKWTLSKHRDANWNATSQRNEGSGILVGKESMLDRTTEEHGWTGQVLHCIVAACKMELLNVRRKCINLVAL